MKEIQLSRGLVAIVGDYDYESLSKYKWSATKEVGDKYKTFYAFRNKKGGGVILMHNQIMENYSKSVIIDHVDGNGLLNTRDNLRKSTKAQNAQNRRIPSNNTSGYKGIVFNKVSGNWKAVIRALGRLLLLGFHNNKIDAAKSYDLGALIYYGEFANLNFPILGQWSDLLGYTVGVEYLDVYKNQLAELLNSDSINVRIKKEITVRMAILLLLNSERDLNVPLIDCINFDSLSNSIAKLDRYEYRNKEYGLR